ncbi:MAG: hypothetical protein K0Q55_1892 [Verrucomicrobia bacterium]|jgi:hypothetical protein|nr:hypothetical protein [Verrucomicrobiota bacterium]
MKFAKLVNTIALSSLCLAGCTKSEDTSVVAPPPPAQPGGGAVELNNAAATPPPSAPVAPPAPDAVAAPMAAAEPEPKEFKDPDGKTISIMQHMEALVQGYERTRAGRDPGQELPPLTNINQLVTMRLVQRLPAAPAGQKFVFDPATGKVSLAPL